MTVPINYLAVLVAAIINMFLGYLWYGPFFAKPWMRMANVNMDTKPSAPLMTRNMGIMFIGSLLISWVLAHAIIFANAYMQISGASAGLMVGFLNWLGFVAPLTIGVVLWENKPWKLWLINAGYYLVSFCLMGMVLAIWK